MKGPVLLVLIGYMLLALQPVVGEALRLGPASTGAAPSLVIPLVVMVALYAAPATALWAGLLVGLAVDVSTLRGDEALVVVGPHALGGLAGAWTVLRMRTLFMRRNPVAVVVLSVVAALAGAVAATLVFGVRRMVLGASGDVGSGALGSELWARCVGALYTGVPALVLGVVLLPMVERWVRPKPGT